MVYAHGFPNNFSLDEERLTFPSEGVLPMSKAWIVTAFPKEVVSKSTVANVLLYKKFRPSLLAVVKVSQVLNSP